MSILIAGCSPLLVATILFFITHSINLAACVYGFELVATSYRDTVYGYLSSDVALSGWRPAGDSPRNVATIGILRIAGTLVGLLIPPIIIGSSNVLVPLLVLLYGAFTHRWYSLLVQALVFIALNISMGAGGNTWLIIPSFMLALHSFEPPTAIEAPTAGNGEPTYWLMGIIVALFASPVTGLNGGSISLLLDGYGDNLQLISFFEAAFEAASLNRALNGDMNGRGILATLIATQGTVDSHVVFALIIGLVAGWYFLSLPIARYCCPASVGNIFKVIIAICTFNVPAMVSCVLFTLSGLRANALSFVPLPFS